MPYIHLETRDLEYEFSFKTKFLIISGDSGIGKSNLVDLVSRYEGDNSLINNYSDTGISASCSDEQLGKEGNVIFIDEDNALLWKSDVSSIINNSNNYFVIITRVSKITQFKLPLDSLVEFKISEDGRYHTVVPRFPKTDKIEKVGDCIVCEDAKSGKQFLEKVFGQNIETAKSNNRLIKKLKSLEYDSYTLVFDRAGMGYLYERILMDSNVNGYNIVSCIDWDSFESYILESSEYCCAVPEYPDKEVNATRMFKKLIDNRYDKSSLPADMKYPVYWKVRDVKELLKHQKDVSKSTVFKE